MKRAGFLLEHIADPDNLRLAFCKARRGKQHKADVWQYQLRVGERLYELHEQILSGTVPLGNYRYFTIFDPKERVICAADFGERVLHHAIMNVCHPYFERHQIAHSYAGRLGKGTYKALAQARVYSRRYPWFLKLDVRKFFDSLHHPVLKKQMRALFKDPGLLALLYRIIDSYEVLPERGVPIGNLTSQYFANHYLSVCDHYLLEKLRLPALVRYMDDMALWHSDKKQLLDIGRALEDFLQTELHMEFKPWCCNATEKGMPFLGYLVYPDRIRLAKRSRRRFVRKMKFYNDLLLRGVWTQGDFQRHTLPLIAFTEHADALGFRKKVLALLDKGQMS